MLFYYCLLQFVEHLVSHEVEDFLKIEHLVQLYTPLCYASSPSRDHDLKLSQKNSSRVCG